MRARSKDQNVRHRWSFFRPKTLVVLGLIGFALVSFVPQYFRIRAMNTDLNRLRHQLSTLEKQNQTLKGDISRLATDGAVERIAREELGFVKPGEEVILPARPGQAVPLQTGNKQNLPD